MSNITAEQQAIQLQIIKELGVKSDFDPKQEIAARVAFLIEALRSTGAKSLVVGISGGVDSLLAGCLAKIAVERAMLNGQDAELIALRLPYGQQSDAADADACLLVINPEKILDINIKAGADSLLASVISAGQSFTSDSQQDFIHGNIKARQRMVCQYAVAAANFGLVVGTDQAAETLMGFSTKYGDNAADLMPLAGLNKRQVRAMASALGAPENLVFKVPTADLKTLTPQKPDEESMGVSYDQIDDFLEGKEVAKEAYDTIIAAWNKTAHKRSLPKSPV